ARHAAHLARLQRAARRRPAGGERQAVIRWAAAACALAYGCATARQPPRCAQPEPALICDEQGRPWLRVEVESSQGIRNESMRASTRAIRGRLPLLNWLG